MTLPWSSSGFRSEAQHRRILVDGTHAYPVCSAVADGPNQSGLVTVSDETAVPAKVVTVPRHGKGAPFGGPGTPPELGIAARQDWRSPGEVVPGLVEFEVVVPRLSPASR